MPANNSHLQSLFEKYMSNTCAKEEWEELLQLVREETHEEDLTRAFQSYWDKINTIENNPSYWNEKFNAMMLEIGHEGHKGYKGYTKNTTKVKRMYKWVAAASIILIIGIATYLVIARSGADPSLRSGQAAQATHDVPAPSNTRAVITLADGSKVYLDSVSKGTIAQENNVNVVKNEKGEIVYSHEGAKAQSEIAYNTLSNPRGSKVISLTLSDGTKVWLNSESSLKYPIAFNASTREVEITGEAYFEVKHNAEQPFKVHLPNGSTVEDIGTAFNVNAYTDEESIKTTLIEGSIKVSSRLSAFVAKPKVGEQVIEQTTSPNHFITTSPDIDEVTAWKNGQFAFGESTDLKQIMKQISRWYDVDVVYQDNVQQEFGGSISRQLNVSKVLEKFELTGKVHFKIEGKKVIVNK